MRRTLPDGAIVKAAYASPAGADGVTGSPGKTMLKRPVCGVGDLAALKVERQAPPLADQESEVIVAVISPMF